MNIIENYIRNTDEILQLVEQHTDYFVPRNGDNTHEGIIPGLCSRFHTLHDTAMSPSLIDAIFRDADFPENIKKKYSFIQIQRYNPGDYIVYHTDIYEIRRLYLVTLTSSDSDGLCVVHDGILKKIYDKAGTLIDFPYEAVHGVEPVRDMRYSLVVGI